MNVQVGINEQGPVTLDVHRLIETRALIQGNSGAGKSRLIRLLAERLAGLVPVIILDREGEFSTLREKYDMALIGAEGEAPATVRTAGPLALKLRELRTSAIIDLYDLQPQERREYVQHFLENLIAAPKSLWSEMIVIVDEAHEFCPESGQAESSASMISLASIGRKRGLCPIYATQRLAKLHKDAVAELANTFIGRTTLDVDQKRATDALGMARKDRLLLRDTKPCTWFTFGPAFNTSGIATFAADQVETTHPTPGQNRRDFRPPAPSEAVRKIAAQLASVADETPAIRDLDAALARINELEKAARTAPPTKPSREEIERAVAGALGVERNQIRSLLSTLEGGLAQALRGYNAVSQALGGASLTIEMTPAGAAAEATKPKQDDDPLARMNKALKKPHHRALFQAMRDLLPAKKVSREALAKKAEMSERSSQFHIGLSELRKLGVFSYPSPGQVSFNPDLVAA